MLSGVFRFVLPELLLHFVLRDLLRSFRLERPVSSSRVPPWDLSCVLSFLRGPPFEPLSSCPLRELTRKVLFLLALATACRVNKLHAVCSVVSFSAGDVYLSFLPEFRTKSESEAHPLPSSFRVRSLSDFVGSLPDKLLLCTARVLWVGVSRLYSLSFFVLVLFSFLLMLLFVLCLKMLSASFFVDSYSSAGLFFPVVSSSSYASSSSSSRPRSSFRAYGVRGVAASWTFHRTASLSSVLEASTWSSASVFTSFYLSNVRFSSSQGFGLGPVVAAGSVV